MYISPSFGINSKNRTVFKSQNNDTSGSIIDSGRNLLMGTLLALASVTPVNSSAINLSNGINNTEISEVLPKKNSIIAETAEKMNLVSTPNKKVYYNPDKKIHFIWNDKEQTFEKAKHITTIYKTGYMKTKKGEYLDPDGKTYIYKDLGKYLIPRNGGFRELGRALAVVNGYKQSDIAKDLLQYGISNNQQLEVYYDKEKEEYLRWNVNNNTFEKSPVTEVIGEYYSEGDKRFKINYNGRSSTISKVCEKDYQANKAGLLRIEGNDSIFTDKRDWYSDRTYYYWNKDTEKLIPIGQKVDIANMLAQKASGEIGYFRQGDMGDCWLLAVINGMLNHPVPEMREKFTKELKKCYSIDEDNNITVHLKGVHKDYTFTPQEIDSVITKNNHYAIGSREVVAIEMGVEKYLRTLTDSKFSRRAYTNTFNMQIPPMQVDPDYVLDGGTSHNAIHIITGKEAHLAIPTGYDNILKIDNTFQKGRLDDKFLLDKLKTNIVLLGYKEKTSPEAHIVSLYGIDDNNFYVIDSNRSELDPDRSTKIKTIPKDKMYDMLNDVEFSDLNKNLTPEKTKPIRVKCEAAKDIRSQLPECYFK